MFPHIGNPTSVLRLEVTLAVSLVDCSPLGKGQSDVQLFASRGKLEDTVEYELDDRARCVECCFDYVYETHFSSLLWFITYYL